MFAVRLTLSGAAVVLGVLAYRVQVHDLYSPSDKAVAIVAVAWAFLVAGLAAWARRPANRLGPLMVAAGLALLLRQLRYSHDPLVFTVFFAFGEASYALVAHAVLAYPSGRLVDQAERMFVRVAYVVSLALPITTLLFYDATRPLHFFDPMPRKSLLLISGNAQVVDVLQKTFVIVAWGVLASLFILLIARKLVQATPRARRLLAPLLLAAVAVTLRAVFESVFTFVPRPSAIVSDDLFWWQIAGFIALPLTLLAGLLRARLARANVADLVLELDRTPPQQLRTALARALGDPTLELAFWTPARRGYVDGEGQPYTLPVDDARRAVTKLAQNGKPVAALVHDPALREEPKLLEGVGAAARLAVENARLQAELKAQLSKVRDSRARLVATGDAERRRIERDLHDGAQQRLVALALELRLAQRRLGMSADPEVEAVLAAAVDDLQLAVSELRELARGVHPPLLTQAGLAVALSDLLSRTPVPVTIKQPLPERLPADVEATAYFVACEALANTVKHAHASKVEISIVREDQVLIITVEDDGVGGADVDGHGLRGLADRLEARGGRLWIDSPHGQGTRLVGEIPCVS